MDLLVKVGDEIGLIYLKHYLRCFILSLGKKIAVIALEQNYCMENGPKNSTMLLLNPYKKLFLKTCSYTSSILVKYKWDKT